MDIPDRLERIQKAISDTDGDCILLYANEETGDAHFSAVVDEQSITYLMGYFLQENPQLIPAVLQSCALALKYNAENLLENISPN